MKYLTQTLAVVSVVLLVLAASPLHAQQAQLPTRAIPGLRYYYPPEKVEPRVIETDVCIYGGIPLNRTR